LNRGLNCASVCKTAKVAATIYPQVKPIAGGGTIFGVADSGARVE